MKFCTHCGNLLPPDVRFCSGCGAPISIVTQNLPETAERIQPGSYVNSPVPGISGEVMLTNTQRRIVNVWYFITLIFLVGIFVPSWLEIDGMDRGFGISFFCGFMVMVGLIVIFIYSARSKQMDKILSGEGRIAYWQYPNDEWYRFIIADFEEERIMKRNLFFMVAGISVIVGVVLAFLVEQPIIIVIIIAGIILLVSIPAYLVPRYRFSKLKNSKAEALITENGLIVGKMLHLWIGMGARLDRVSMNMEAEPKMVEFTYSMPARHGRQTEVARVPVPQGKIDEAVALVGHFNNRRA